MPKSFSQQVRGYTTRYRRRMDATFKQSTQDVANEASVPKAQGGNMPVDTSFLRNSIRADIGRLPTGPSEPSRRGDEGNAGAVNDVSLSIARANFGDVLYVGWTANYARIMENENGFLEAAAQNWNQIVKRNAARARSQIK